MREEPRKRLVTRDAYNKCIGILLSHRCLDGKGEDRQYNVIAAEEEVAAEAAKSCECIVEVKGEILVVEITGFPGAHAEAEQA